MKAKQKNNDELSKDNRILFCEGIFAGICIAIVVINW